MQIQTAVMKKNPRDRLGLILVKGLKFSCLLLKMFRETPNYGYNYLIPDN